MSTRKKHRTDGQILLKSGTFYIRYHDGIKRVAKKLTHPDGSPVRRDDRRFKTSTSKAVNLIADEFMLTVKKTPRSNSYDLAVADFWDTEFLPWAKDVKKMRPSTIYGYEKVWSLYLKAHFKDITLRDYRVVDGSELLTQLASKERNPLGTNTLQHVRGLARHIFAYAVSLGKLERNVWKEVICHAKIKDSEPTVAYTLEEAKAIRAALASRLDAQCVFDFCFCLGLRPSEVSALCWQHISGDQVTVQQAAVRGDVNETKTEKVITHRLIEPLKSELAAWKKQCGAPDAGYILPSSKGGPTNIESLVPHAIKPLLKAAGIAWSGLYAARRGHDTQAASFRNASDQLYGYRNGTIALTAAEVAKFQDIVNGNKIAMDELADQNRNLTTQIDKSYSDTAKKADELAKKNMATFNELMFQQKMYAGQLVLEYNNMVDAIMKLPASSSTAVAAMVPSLIQVRDAMSSGQQAAHDMGITLKTDLIDQLQIASNKLDAFTNSGIKDQVALKALTKDFDDAYKAVQNYGNEVHKVTLLTQAAGAIGKDMAGDFNTAFINAATGAEGWGQAMEKATGQALSSLGRWCQTKMLENLALAAENWENPGPYLMAAGEFEAAAVACGVAGAMMSGTSGGAGAGSSGNMGSQQHQGIQTTGSTSQGTVTSTNVQRFAAGALVSQPTMAMIGDAPGGGSAREGVLPLDNPEAMKQIAGAIAEHLSGNNGLTFNTHVRGGVIDAGTLKSVMKQMSKKIQRGTGSMLSSNTHRITRRSP